EFCALGGDARFDGVGVVNACCASSEQPEVAIHRVLIQRDQQVQAVAHVGDFFRSGADREKRVTAADDRLIGVVSIQVQPSAAKDLCEDVARRSDALTGGASDADGKALLHSNLL